MDVASIQMQAKDCFDGWGGEQELQGLFPNMPAMSGPRPVVIKPPDRAPDSTREDFEVTDEPRPSFKGIDVPIGELEGGAA